jgi:pimeloyl-ACP methyl ester carboxylesterase
MYDKKTTIVLIHGLWMSPHCWNQFKTRYEAQGYRVIAPAWPRMRGTVEELRADPSPLAGLGLREVADHYDQIVRGLDAPPILIGHSMGGLIVQLLLNRGLGSAGVAIDSATPAGIYQLPWSVIRSGMPVLKNPLNFGRTVALTFEEFRYAFAHVMPEAAARAAYEQDAVPGPGRPLFEVASGNFNPWAPNRLDYARSDRAPLLLIAGAEDRLVPAKLNRINARRYRRSPAVTDYKEFPNRSHLIIGQAGWEEVSDFALTWSQEALSLRRHEVGAVPLMLKESASA